MVDQLNDDGNDDPGQTYKTVTSVMPDDFVCLRAGV